jgi:hypothetical protein
MNWNLLFVILMVFFGGFTFMDWFIYTVKSTPKSSMFPRWFWILGFVSMIGIAYWFFNGKTF